MSASRSARPPLPLRELLEVTAPLSFQVGGDDGPPAPLTIKGFASVQTPDRSGHVVAPDQFNVQQFLATAAPLLVNHDFWRDEQGNRVAAGKVSTARAAILTEAGADAANWLVVDEITGQQIDTFPRAKVPGLAAGVRGLFVTCEVTQSGVVQMIARGELASFSWKGLTQVSECLRLQGPRAGTVERVLTDIDLFEISLVNVPDNPGATFVTKSAVKELRLDKSRFTSVAELAAFQQLHRLDAPTECPEFFIFSLTDDPRRFGKLVAMKMADGVTAIAEPDNVRLTHQTTSGFPMTELELQAVADKVAAIMSGRQQPQPEPKQEHQRPRPQQQAAQRQQPKTLPNGLTDSLSDIIRAATGEELSSYTAEDLDDDAIRGALSAVQAEFIRARDAARQGDHLERVRWRERAEIEKARTEIMKAASIAKSLTRLIPNGMEERDEGWSPQRDRSPNSVFDSVMPGNIGGGGFG